MDSKPTRPFDDRLRDCPAELQSAYARLVDVLAPLEATSKDTPNGEGRTFRVSGARVLRIDPKPVGRRLGVWLPLPEATVLRDLAGAIEKGWVGRRQTMSSETATWIDLTTWNDQLEGAFRQVIGRAARSDPLVGQHSTNDASEARSSPRKERLSSAPPATGHSAGSNTQSRKSQTPEALAFGKYLERRINEGELVADPAADETYCPNCKSHHAIRRFVDRGNDLYFYICRNTTPTGIVVANARNAMRVLSLHDLMTEYPALKGVRPSWLRRLAAASQVELTLMPPFVSLSIGKHNR